MPINLHQSTSSYQHYAKHYEADVVVVGAGVLGCALSIALARQGRSVVLIERSLKEPDRIVGELLQPGGVQALAQLGLHDCLAGIDSVAVEGYHISYRGQSVLLPYPRAEDTSSIKWPKGRSFHHGRLIQRLRESAQRERNIRVVETTAKSTVQSDFTGRVLGVECMTKGIGSCYFGDLTVIADGFASAFRKTHITHVQPKSTSRFYALELQNCPLPHRFFGHVILSSAAPILLYQIGTHETRMLIDIPNDICGTFDSKENTKNYLRKLVLPLIPGNMHDCFISALESGELRSMPNSWLPPSPQTRSGVVMLGDAMNMRHPLTGGGMTVAFSDVVLLASVLHPKNVQSFADKRIMLRQMKSFHRRRKRVAGTINVLAQSLYAVFSAQNRSLGILQKGCFCYFQDGGPCINGPMKLLSGLEPDPLALVYHFFAVAVLAIRIHLSSTYGLVDLLVRIYDVANVLWSATAILLPLLFNELLC